MHVALVRGFHSPSHLYWQVCLWAPRCSPLECPLTVRATHVLSSLASTPLPLPICTPCQLRGSHTCPRSTFPQRTSHVHQRGRGPVHPAACPGEIADRHAPRAASVRCVDHSAELNTAHTSAHARPGASHAAQGRRHAPARGVRRRSPKVSRDGQALTTRASSRGTAT